MKTGLGVDIHKFAKGRKLILGGVEIPYQLGLKGISDADVILHSISDAILGALSLGDLGDYFPPDDPKNRGISSIKILKKVLSFLKQGGINNLDITLITEKPRLKEYKDKITSNISKLLSLPKNRVNLKVKSQEALIPAKKECAICLSIVTIKPSLIRRGRKPYK